MDQHESAAPEVSGSWVSNGKRESDGDRCVNGVSALLEHGEPDEGSDLLLGYNHAVSKRCGFRRTFT